MKKVFLSRLFAIAFFCMAFLSIKSETSSCRSICTCGKKSPEAGRLTILNDDARRSYYPYDAFFIKI